MKTYLVLTLIAAMAVPAWADFNSDLAVANSLNVAQKYTAAVAAYQTAIVSATSVADKESTTHRMAKATRRSGNMAGGLKILTDLASATAITRKFAGHRRILGSYSHQRSCPFLKLKR